VPNVLTQASCKKQSFSCYQLLKRNKKKLSFLYLESTRYSKPIQIRKSGTAKKIENTGMHKVL